MHKPTAELPTRAEWMAIIQTYQHPNARVAWWQFANTFTPLLLLFGGLLYAVRTGHYLALLATPLLAGLIVRVFILQHDCGHGSFLPKERWNEAVGRLCSLFTFTPYAAWRHDHAVHHAAAGSLDRRGIGDIRTLTLAEYRDATPSQRLWYRIYRHPLAMFGVGPALHFALAQRWPFALPAKQVRERRSIHATNLALLGFYGLLAAAFGLLPLLLVVGPTLIMSASAGVYLFYVQHQFNPGYWEHDDRWDFVAVALRGSSYLRLPALLEWFTGSIGYHHIHHLGQRIPNYHLRRCHHENEVFWSAPTLTLWRSLQTMRLTLWDEEQGALVGFDEAHRRAA